MHQHVVRENLTESSEQMVDNPGSPPDPVVVGSSGSHPQFRVYRPNFGGRRGGVACDLAEKLAKVRQIGNRVRKDDFCR